MIFESENIVGIVRFTTVLGVCLDELEIPYAFSMFDWASSVWVLKEDEMTGRIYVDPHLSGSRALNNNKVSAVTYTL